MDASKNSFFPTSFGRRCFSRFENDSDLQKIYLTLFISKTSFYCRLLPSCSGIVKYEL